MPFQPGHHLATGRPKGSKNQLPRIRDKLFNLLLRRLARDRELESVDTSTLIKFCSACLPKDMSLSVNRQPDITYISNVPRPELQNNDLQQKSERDVDVSDSQKPLLIDIHTDTET